MLCPVCNTELVKLHGRPYYCCPNGHGRLVPAHVANPPVPRRTTYCEKKAGLPEVDTRFSFGVYGITGKAGRWKLVKAKVGIDTPCDRQVLAVIPWRKGSPIGLFRKKEGE